MNAASARQTSTRMPVELALRHLQSLRTDRQVVITNQASARLWPRISQHPLDFNYNPSTMGGAIPLAVGAALARPDLEIIVLSGDGSLLMSLGSLVTVIASGVSNLSVLLLDNGRYEVTGGQKTPGSDRSVDFAALARAAGFPSVAHFAELDDWRRDAAAVLRTEGPRLVWLEVGPTPPDCFADQPPPLLRRLAEFQSALRASQSR